MKKLFKFSYVLIIMTGLLSFVPELVSGTVYYVDGSMSDDSGDGLSWATAFKTVNQGTYIADYTDQVWVKAGFYLPTSDPGYYLDVRETSFIIYNKQAIYGGFAGWESSTSQRDLATNITILSGDIGTLGDPSDNSYNVFWTGWDNCPDGITLDGLTIQDGNANVLNNFEAGGAFYLSNNRITIRNCTFKNNYAEYQGGAIYGEDGCQMTIDNCKFSNNVSGKGGGAISVYSGSSFTVRGDITNCEFYQNQTFQGGAAVNVGWNDSDGNMYFTFINTVFHDNNSNDNSGSGSGGAVQVSRSLAGTNVTKFINCLFYANHAGGWSDDGGGAIMIYRGDVQVYYSTIANNTSATKGGAISLYRPGCNLTLVNSIVSGNTSVSGNSVSNDGGGSANVSYTLFDDKVSCGLTCLPGLTCGNGVLFGRNPMFVSSTDFQLQSCSPAIDQGNNGEADEQATDLAGNNRRYSPYGNSPTKIDMGAYEFSSNITVCSTCIPSSGSLSKSPNQAIVCIGSIVSASLTATGSNGDGIDQLEYRTKTLSGWSSWSCYTTGDIISTSGKTEVEIRTYRNSSFCPASTPAVANWAVDPTPPVVVTKNITRYLDATGNVAITVSDIDNGSTDNCSISTRVAGKTDFTCSNTGGNAVSLTVTDNAGNIASANSTVTIVDTILPHAHSTDIIRTLDPYGTDTITASDIDNGSHDNCTFELSASKTTFNCSNLGNNTVRLTVTDASGNTSTANSLVTVVEGTALLPPWGSCVIGASSGTAIYTPCTGPERFTLSSKSYSSSTSDVIEFVNQSLTGNGYIIARIANISNTGWAGLQMRESCGTGSKKVVFKTQLYKPEVLNEYRSITNGQTVSRQYLINSGIKWIKLQRAGNNFTGYTSPDGVIWKAIFTLYNSMNASLQAGIFTEGNKYNQTVVAQFEHVLVGVSTKETEFIIPESGNGTSGNLHVELFPNPATDEVNISVPCNEGKVKIAVASLEGKVLQTLEFSGSETQLDISRLQPGVYLIRFETEAGILTKRLVVM